MKEAAQFLLVDDSRMDVELMQEAFRHCDDPPSLHVCLSGEEALQFLGSLLESDRPTLPAAVLLDVKMPGLKGHEVLERIKQTPGLDHLPVIIMTNSKEESDIAKCYAMGANSYLVKPVSFEELIRLAQLLTDYWLRVNVNSLTKEALRR